MGRHPEVPEELWQEGRDAGRSFLNGVLNFLISSLLYAAALWFWTKTLHDADVISWRFTWIQSTGIANSFNFIRIWDRAFMR